MWPGGLVGQAHLISLYLASSQTMHTMSLLHVLQSFFILIGWAHILLEHTSRLPVEVLPLNLSRPTGYYMYHQISTSETSLKRTYQALSFTTEHTQKVFRVFRLSQRSECSCSVVKENVLLRISGLTC